MKQHKVWLVAALLAVVAVAAASAALPPDKNAKGAGKGKEVTALPPDLAQEIFIILEKGTRIADMETRAMAVLYIGQVRPDLVKDYVVDALGDPQWIVRYSAIQALIKMKNPEYRKTLAAAVANAALYEKKHLSPLNLVLQLEPKEAIELLREALTKAEAARDIILGEVFKKDSQIAVQYFEALKDLPPVKTWALSHLEMFKDKALFPLLVKSIPKMSKEEVLKVFAFLETLDVSYDMTFLTPYLKDKDVQLQEGAAFILAVRGDKKAVAIMLPLCDENELDRQLRCLGAIKGSATDPEILERSKLFLFGDPDARLLDAAYEIFVIAQDESVYERLMARLNSTNLQYRVASVRYLHKIRGIRALPELHGLLKDGAVQIRKAAAEGLGALRQVESVPHLAMALRDENDIEVQKAMITALGNIADVSVITSISSFLAHPGLSDTTVAAMSKINHPNVIPYLRNVLQNRYSLETRVLALKSIIRVSAAEGFPIFKGCIGWIPVGFITEMAQEQKGNFVEYLREGMKAPRDEIRRESVLAFRFAGPELEEKVLSSELFQSKDLQLRGMILERMVEIKGPESVSILEAFLNDQNKDLRITAIRLVANFAKPDSPATAKLRLLLMDADETYRIHAAVALVRIYLG